MSYHAFGAGHPRPQATAIPRFGRGVSRTRRYNPRPTLADDADFYARAEYGHAELDDDLECGTWPDMIDQTNLSVFAASPCWHDDAEDDDPDTGIEDEAQDAREEDGI